MKNYRFDFLNPAGEQIRSEMHAFKEDIDALDTARTLGDGYAIEIWNEDYRVARVKRRDAMLNERDLESL
ncbi:MAG TPA: hypothetical protein VHL34_06805 [Rhizomicrobium sp.]|jgi:hypothetical protein|nr:hypothetical protein [Rhizomicrobium sp.]